MLADALKSGCLGHLYSGMVRGWNAIKDMKTATKGQSGDRKAMHAP